MSLNLEIMSRHSTVAPRVLVILEKSEMSPKGKILRRVPLRRWVPTIRRQTIRSSSDQVGAKVFNLLDEGSAFEPLLYGYQANYLPSKQWLADDESFTHEVVQAPRLSLNLTSAAGASQ
jgi:hypothetical protein